MGKLRSASRMAMESPWRWQKTQDVVLIGRHWDADRNGSVLEPPRPLCSLTNHRTIWALLSGSRIFLVFLLSAVSLTISLLQFNIRLALSTCNLPCDLFNNDLLLCWYTPSPPPPHHHHPHHHHPRHHYPQLPPSPLPPVTPPPITTTPSSSPPQLYSKLLKGASVCCAHANRLCVFGRCSWFKDESVFLIWISCLCVSLGLEEEGGVTAMVTRQ